MTSAANGATTGVHRRFETGPLADGEMPRWVDALVALTIGGAAEEPTDPEYVRTTVQDRVAAEGGCRAATLVHEAARPVVSARLVECRHPLTLRTDLRIEDLAAFTGPLPPSDVVAVMSRLLDALPGSWPVRAELPVRGPAAAWAASLAGAGFVPEVLTVRRATADVPPAGGCRVRPATPADAPFVQDCLARAIHNGLAGEPPAVDVDEWARRRFADPFHSGATCIIAERRGRRLGHVYATVGPDRYRRIRLANIHDVYVVPEAKRQGVAHALTAALADHLSRSGVPMMEGEVIMRGDPQQALRAGLAAVGWREDRIRWVRPAPL
ncbi:GNAT family N-acetyltransferase [Actinoplanes subglobosus]|uniref:GNAT family N-acetyltransferase n=1 Tax=Actinoplanes subglobosus TaxID=1547892 RepID=A0ABV8J8L2_9ACTN